MSIVLQGSTSGSVTLQEPAVAGTTVLDLPAVSGTVITTGSSGGVSQAMLATGVAGTGPAFSAYQSSGQTLSSNTLTKILFQTEEFDTNNNFASSTFTPTVAGYYQINSALEVNSTACSIVIRVYKNGSLWKTTNNQYNASISQLAGSCLVYCNGTTDYVEIYAQLSTGQLLAAAAGSTYFQAAMIRGA